MHNSISFIGIKNFFWNKKSIPLWLVTDKRRKLAKTYTDVKGTLQTIIEGRVREYLTLEQGTS